MCSIVAFGKQGARFLVGATMLISMVGWSGLNCNVCGESFASLVRTAFGMEVPVMASSVFWEIVMLISAVYGMNAFRRLDAVALPLLVLLMILGTILAFLRYGAEGLSLPSGNTMTFVQGMGLSFSFTAAGAITSADITRFQKSRKDTVKSVFWGIMPAGIFTLCLGILMTKMTGNYDITSVLTSVGLPVSGVLVLILATWTTNSLNAYSAGLDAVMVFGIPDQKRKAATAVAGLAGIVLAAAGILGHMETFLSLLSYVFSAVGGVMTADYWIVRKGRKESWHEKRGWNPTGVLAMILAIGAAVIVKVDYSGIIWGFFIYLIVERLLPGSREKELPSTEEEQGKGNEEK